MLDDKGLSRFGAAEECNVDISRMKTNQGIGEEIPQDDEIMLSTTSQAFQDCIDYEMHPDGSR